MIIILRFGENNVLCSKYINIYEFWGVWGGGQKNVTSSRARPILKSNSTSF